MYKVVPFKSYVTHNGNPGQISDELQNIINSEAGNGWIFVQLQELNTVRAGSNGCFGFGGKDAEHLTMAVLVFRQA
jgi:hypothetical protein